jgi:hypothetical protein
VYGFFFDANRWKTWLHEGLALTFNRQNLETARGGITIFVATDPNEHLSFAKHLTAEKQVTKFEPGKGYAQVWEAIRDSNHWLDATSMACVAGHKCGFRIQKEVKQPIILPGIVSNRGIS